MVARRVLETWRIYIQKEIAFGGRRSSILLGVRF